MTLHLLVQHVLECWKKIPKVSFIVPSLKQTFHSIDKIVVGNDDTGCSMRHGKYFGFEKRFFILLLNDI